MNPDVTPLIDQIADRADDFLAGIRDRAQAREAIAELLAADYPTLDAATSAAVTAGVMAILEAEDFFGLEFVGDPFAEAENAGED